jgi:hypothetical protein
VVKECQACHALKPLSEFYTHGNNGQRVPYNRCKACHNSANYRARLKRLSPTRPQRASSPPSPLPRSPIPISEVAARCQQDASQLAWLLARYTLRDAQGARYIRLRATRIEFGALIEALWDATIEERFRFFLEEGKSEGQIRILGKIFQSALAGSVRAQELCNQFMWVVVAP